MLVMTRQKLEISTSLMIEHCSKKKMCLIHGSLLHYGHLVHWVGQHKPIILRNIFQPVSSLLVLTSFSFGLLA